MGSSPSTDQQLQQPECSGKTNSGAVSAPQKKKSVVLTEEQEKIRQAFIRQGKLELYNSLHERKPQSKGEQKLKEQLRIQTQNKVQEEVNQQMKKLRRNSPTRLVNGDVLETVRKDFFREDVEKLQLKNIVGEGGWGKVRKAEYKKLGVESEYKPCAVKEFMSSTFDKEQFPGHWEISIIKQLNHKNIVKYISHTMSQVNANTFKVCLIMEYLEIGSLRSFLEQKPARGGLSDPFVTSMGKQICAALFYIHNTHRLVHRDVKPANILIDYSLHKSSSDKSGEIIFKLCDFGCARKFEDLESGPVSVAYAAPEILWGEAHKSGACDIYSLGLTMLQCSSGESPKVISNEKTLQKLVNQQARQLEGMSSLQLRNLVKQCIWMDPAERITSKALLTAICKL